MTEAMRLMRTGDLGGAAALLGGALPATPQAAPFELKPQPRTGRSSSPAAGKFAAHRHGGLAYKLYTPAAATAGMPLLVMLHGCTQSPDDFAAGTGMNALADELGVVVAWPAQSQSANPQKCWNWFRPGDQNAGAGEPAMLAGLARHLVAEHRLDDTRVFAAGLSAGGAAAAILASAYPDVFAAVGVHSGLACGAARDVPSAMAAMRQGGGRAERPDRFVPLITFHGDRDATVAEINAREIVAAAASAADGKLSTRVETGRSAGGRDYTRAISRDAAGHDLIEQWTIAGAGHAWSGGDAAGSYTDPAGPDASRAMLDFFLRAR